MKIQQLLNRTDHRPWELPNENWRYYQEWNGAVFLHWPVDLDELRKHVPAEMEIDLFEGKAWVSLVAFTMENIRPAYIPPFSPISYFHEVNIRTYTRMNAKTGVYFLSMEGSKWLSCKLAKAMSDLPYHFSRMKRGHGSFASDNAATGDHLLIEYAAGEETVKKTPLDKWLTERYALHQDAGKAIHEFEVHHVEWPVQLVKITKLDLSYPRFNSLLFGKPALQHYSAGVQVLAWGKEKLNNNGKVAH